MEKQKQNLNQELEKKLFQKKENNWNKLDSKQLKECEDLSEKYLNFLKNSKTQRECIKTLILELKESNFKNIDKIKELKTGDKIYKNIKNKVVIACVVGDNKSEFRLIGSHTDSPKLDLKPNPLYEDSNLAMLKTHYYGGIKKYQWVNVPLSLHGIIYTKSGEKIELSIGDKQNEPKFIIPDLIVHLSFEQIQKPASKVIEGEDLQIIFGSIPVKDEKITQKVKFEVLKHLYEKYQIIEEDFNYAELEFVPSQNPFEIGIDKGLIGSYGQDDKICVFTSLEALKKQERPKYTSCGFFIDKEEIGSTGDTGADSFILLNFTRQYLKLAKLKINEFEILKNSLAISADVKDAMNPIFKSVNDPQNVNYLGNGINISKYSGSRGKYNTNDASCEYLNFIRTILNENKICSQTGEIGKIDLGGGGTIAHFLSRFETLTIDCGPSVLSMHSPCEISSKVDLYSTYLFYTAFFKNKKEYKKE